MVQLTEAVWLKVALVPVTVMLYVPAAALPAASESVELPPAATDAGLKFAVAPAGTPLAASATLPLKPPLPVTLMLLVAAAPLTDAGLAARLKSGVEEPQPETELPGKQTLRTACSSIPLGEMPACPCGRSKNPTPVTMTGTLALWKTPLAVNFASKAARDALICAAHGPPDTQLGDGISTIIVWPLPSVRSRW